MRREGLDMEPREVIGAAGSHGRARRGRALTFLSAPETGIGGAGDCRSGVADASPRARTQSSCRGDVSDLPSGRE
jgi:hypothetical protein